MFTCTKFLLFLPNHTSPVANVLWPGLCRIAKDCSSTTYLEVFDVWEGNSNGDHCSGIVICEVKSFTHFTPTDSNQQSTIYNKERVVRMAWRRSAGDMEEVSCCTLFVCGLSSVGALDTICTECECQSGL